VGPGRGRIERRSRRGRGSPDNGGGAVRRTGRRDPVLKGRVEEQEAYLQTRIGEIPAVGAELEETQTRVDGAPTSSVSRATCIVARVVKPISQKAYREPYKVAAERYGFGEDWYVLKVLGVAEGYRRLAGDDTVRPYI
jgi:hypothetical protein